MTSYTCRSYPMRLRCLLERHPGAGVLWSGPTSKVSYHDGELWDDLEVCLHWEMIG